MDYLSPILEVATRLWNCSSKRLDYVHNFEENLRTLRTENGALKNRTDDVRRRVEETERQPRMGRTKEVGAWLANAETMEGEVSSIIFKGDRELHKKCVGSCCPKNLKSTYKIGKQIIKKIDSVKDQLYKGEPFLSNAAIVLPQPLLRLLMPKWPLENTVGLDSAVERVWRCIEDENVKAIRLCGTGGIGKTILFKKVSNEFHRRSHDFDAVIWAEVPRQKDYIEKVQEVVRKKLDIPHAVWNQCSGEDEKGAQISSVLNDKKFVLLLDNVWEQFNLLKLGINWWSYQHCPKVIFTTRSLQLHFDREAEVTIEVEFLPPEQALSLFRMTAGESILSSDPDLSELANTSARRCGGLPLALLTVARAMACRKTLREWRYTDELLRTNPWEIASMGAYVLPLLKFSYDSLNDDTAKNCFLYCSIFPEDYNIRIDELIDLWIGEGFLDGPNPCDQGEFIVGTLKLACMLEKGDSKQCVRMHDILRHLALWLARDQGKNKKKVLVAKGGRITIQKLTEWKEANWISMFGSRVIIDHSPSCPLLSTLSTLLLRDAQLQSIPSGFFDSMPTLKVLDLSGNQGLVVLPADIGNVKNLQCLNLSSTSIAELPNGLGNFRKLKCLLLDYIMNLEWVPKEVISDLSDLHVYSKINGVTEYSGSVEILPYDEVGFLEVLEGLNHINKVGVTIFFAPSLEKILKSYILRSCIRNLTFIESTGLVSLYFGEDLSNLERLELFHCISITEFKVSEQCKLGNLSKVHIAACPLLLNLNYLAYARKLEILTIVDCASLMEVTSENTAFPGLKTLSLTRLRNLKSICPSPRCFPSLLEIEVSECP